MRFPRPPARPHDLPPEILWTWDDCKNDTFVGMTASNVSRPPMRRAIRHENGNVITDAEWKAIRQSATLVARTHLFPLSRVSQTGAKQTRKKMYFKRYFSLEWAAALRELESLAPLLSLCFGEYKADHTLGGVLHDETSPRAAPPVSRASTPSSLGPSRPPARIGPPRRAPPRGTPASTLDLPPPSNSPRHAPPRGSPASSLADLPPSTAPSSTVGRHPPSPRRVALKSSQRDPKPPPTVAKGKRRREPSPEQVEKRVRSAEPAGALTPTLCHSVTLTPPRCREIPIPIHFPSSRLPCHGRL